MVRFKKIIFFFLLFVFLCQAASVFALEINWPSLPGAQSPSEGQALGSFLKYFLTLFFLISLSVCVVLVMAGGIAYLVSGAKPAAKLFARNQMTSALTGLFILLVSYLILYAINPELVIFKLAKEKTPTAASTRMTSMSKPTYAYIEVPTGKIIEDSTAGIVAEDDFKSILLQVERVKQASAELKQKTRELQAAVDLCKCGTSRCETDIKFEHKSILGVKYQSALRCQCKPAGCTADSCDREDITEIKIPAVKNAIVNLQAERMNLISAQMGLVHNYLRLKRAGLFMGLPDDVVDYNQFLLLSHLIEQSGGSVAVEKIEDFPSSILEGAAHDPATFYFSYDSLLNQEIISKEAPRTNPALVFSNTAPKELADMVGEVVQNELGKTDLGAALANLPQEKLDDVALKSLDEGAEETFQQVSDQLAQEVSKDMIAAVADEMALAIAGAGFSTPENEVACKGLPFLAKIFLPQTASAAIIEGLEQCSDFSKEIAKTLNDMLYAQLKDKLPESVKNVLTKSMLDVIDIGTVATLAQRVCEPARTSFENVCVPDQTDVRALCRPGTALFNQELCDGTKDIICNPLKANDTEECRNMQGALRCEGMPPGNSPSIEVFGISKNDLCLENRCGQSTLRDICRFVPAGAEKNKYEDLRKEVCPAPTDTKKIADACQKLKEEICSGKCPARPSVILNSTVKRLLLGKEGEQFLQKKVIDTLPGDWGKRLQQRVVDVIPGEAVKNLVWLDNLLRSWEKMLINKVNEGIGVALNHIVGNITYPVLKIVPNWIDRALIVRTLFESINAVVTGIVDGWLQAQKERCLAGDFGDRGISFSAFGKDFAIHMAVTADDCQDFFKSTRHFQKILHQALYTQFYQLFPREVKQILGSSVESAIAYSLQIGCMVNYCGLSSDDILNDLDKRFGKKWTEMDLNTLSQYQITGPCRDHFATHPEDQKDYQKCAGYVQQGKAVFDNRLISVLPDRIERNLTQTFYQAFAQNPTLAAFLQNNLATLIFGADVADILKNKSPWNLLEERKERLVISLSRDNLQEPISFSNFNLIVKAVESSTEADNVPNPKAVFTIGQILEQNIASLLYNVVYQMFIKPYLPYYLRETLYSQLPNAFTLPVWKIPIEPITFRALPDGKARVVKSTPLFTPGTDTYNDWNDAFTKSFLLFLLQQAFPEPYSTTIERESCHFCSAKWQENKCKINVPMFLQGCTIQELAGAGLTYLKEEFLRECDKKSKDKWGDECNVPGQNWLCRCPARYSFLQLIQLWLRKQGGPEKLFNAVLFQPFINLPDAIYEIAKNRKILVIKHEDGSKREISLGEILREPFKEILLTIITEDEAADKQEARRVLYTRTLNLLPETLRKDLQKNVMDIFGERALGKKNFSSLPLVELIPKDTMTKSGENEITYNGFAKILLRLAKTFTKPKERKEICRSLNAQTGKCRGNYLGCETEPAPGADAACQIEGATACVCQPKAGADRKCGTNACCSQAKCDSQPGQCVEEAGAQKCQCGPGYCVATTKQRPWYIEDLLQIEKTTCQALGEIDKMNTLQKIGTSPETMTEYKEIYSEVCQKPMYQAIFRDSDITHFLETSIWQRMPREYQSWLNQSFSGLLAGQWPAFYKELQKSLWDAFPSEIKQLFNQAVVDIFFNELKAWLQQTDLLLQYRNYTPLRVMFSWAGEAAGDRLGWERLYFTLDQKLTQTLPVLDNSFVQILAGPAKCNPQRHLLHLPGVNIAGVGRLPQKDYYWPQAPAPADKDLSCDIWEFVQSSPINLVEKEMAEIIAKEMPQNVKDVLGQKFILLFFDEPSLQALKATPLINFIPCATDKIANKLIAFVCEHKKGSYCEEENAFETLVRDAINKVGGVITGKTIEQMDVPQKLMAEGIASAFADNFAEATGKNLPLGAEERMAQGIQGGAVERVADGLKRTLEQGIHLNRMGDL